MCILVGLWGRGGGHIWCFGRGGGYHAHCTPARVGKHIGIEGRRGADLDTHTLSSGTAMGYESLSLFSGANSGTRKTFLLRIHEYYGRT